MCAVYSEELSSEIFPFLKGGGEMGFLTRHHDWSKTAAGPVTGWPQSLRTTLSIILNSKFPMFLWWGPELICFYNDAYRPSLGQHGKHPKILGMPAAKAWPEIWDVIKPLIDQVLDGGEATWSEDQLIPIYRNGTLENVYWTFSYSPVHDEKGKVAGVLVTCFETTEKIKNLYELQARENQLKFTLEAARDLNPATGTFVGNEQLQAWFGPKELKALNDKLTKSEERYHQMVNEIQDYAILYMNTEGFIENWNKGAEKIKGYEAEEIIGKNFSIFYTDQDQLNKLPQKLLLQARETGKAKQEGMRVRKNGSLFWASVVITAIHGDKGDIIGFSKITHDLTAKKQAEDHLRLNSEQLEQKNRELEKMNSELQSFAYISSHDLQEPLRKIQIFAGRIIEKELENLSEKGKGYFLRMQESANRMQVLIQDLLTYSRTNNMDKIFAFTDLNVILEQVKTDLKETIAEKKVTIESDVLCTINIIPFQFSQLLHNLIGNAIKFARQDENPYIKITCSKIYGRESGLSALGTGKQYYKLSISDNGIGFDLEYRERIFDVFQRLHEQDKYSGTGIGLAIVKKIVENHNGYVKASGELNKGATFDIFLPA